MYDWFAGLSTSPALCVLQYYAQASRPRQTCLSEFSVIKDPMLEQRVAEKLGVRVEDLTAELLLQLDSLDASQLGITTVAGLEQCSNLIMLSLQDNRVAFVVALQRAGLEVWSGGSPKQGITPRG